MIGMNDFKSEPPALRAAMKEAAERVMSSGWFVLGKEVEAFERRWADACGVAACVGVGNGMDAIEIILRALDIGPGDEVITTPMTAFATVLAVLRAGATPVLADIDAGTALLSPESVTRCLTPRTRAVLLVHLYGQLDQMHVWKALCQRAGIHLVEDCAQAHGAQLDGQAPGSFGVAGAYSFYPTKNLGGLGDGGAVVTQSAPLAARMSVLRNYGQSERYVHPELGLNSRLDELQAAILVARLSWLDVFTRRRREIAAFYDNNIRTASVTLLRPPSQASAHARHLYAVTSPHRRELQEHLQRHGVGTLIHYPIPVHHQAPCTALLRDPQGLSATERHAGACLSLPCHPQMSDDDVHKVCDVVNTFHPPA